MNANINYDIPISAFSSARSLLTFVALALLFISAFQFFSFSVFSFYHHPTLNDIAITQMRTLLAASSVKRLK